MNRLLILLLVFFGLIINACKDIYDQDLYKKPDWLKGKLYTQILAQKNLSKFAECLRIVGYDTLLDKSGSFTVFAPSDTAIANYLLANNYKSVTEIPKPTLEKIVKFHIIQDAWSENQLQLLDYNGWIDPLDPKSKPRAYKRQTLLKNPNEKYWVNNNKGEYTILFDSIKANDYKTVYTRSRKYAPIFYDEFFALADLTTEDYEFYFNRPFEPGNIYYAEGKVIQSDIFAENGFVFIIDRVVKPMLNAKELLEQEYDGESYSRFLSLIYQFPKFKLNLSETYKTPEARAGQSYDSLYDLSFPLLPFDLQEELAGPSVNVSNYTYLSHNAVYVPTDDAFQKFLDEMVTEKSGYPHWPNFESIPSEVKQIIVRSHFTNTPVYPSDMSEGFKDGDGNIIHLDVGNVIRKEFGSNCTFLGLNSTVVPRAFSSVTGPVYLRPGYSLFMYAMQLSKVLPAVTKQNAEYCFFPIPDNVLYTDSSLLINWIDKNLNKYRFVAFSRNNKQMASMPAGLLGKRILNQIGKSVPNHSASKEFIETLGGNYLIWNNLDNTVQGTNPNTYGYDGDSLLFYNPVLFEEFADNGKSWMVKSWFSFSIIDIYTLLTSRYRTFRDLLEKAGLYDPKLYDFPFLVKGESYTIFMPSDEALAEFQVDTLSKEDLANLLRYHFIKGEKIFTDNKKAWKNYETLRMDETSTQFSKIFTSLNIRPGYDEIDVLDSKGSLYLQIPETSGKSNIMVQYDTDNISTDKTDYITTTVVHEIDKVLDPKILK